MTKKYQKVPRAAKSLELLWAALSYLKLPENAIEYDQISLDLLSYMILSISLSLYSISVYSIIIIFLSFAEQKILQNQS